MLTVQADPRCSIPHRFEAFGQLQTTWKTGLLIDGGLLRRPLRSGSHSLYALSTSDQGARNRLLLVVSPFYWVSA